MTFERAAAGLVAAVLSIAACQRGAEPPPLAEDPFTLRDRWLDVSTLDGRRVIVIGHGGKIVRSDDGGETWSQVQSPTDRTLTRMGFADAEVGWIVGQDGLVLRTGDGGRTWEPQDSGTATHLFGLSIVSRERVIACGDRSEWIETSDGGRTWSSQRVPIADVGMDPEIALAVEEPVYYDAVFLDASTGWIVGDYGNIRFTDDGGRTWKAQQQSLLGQRLPGARRPLRDALDLPALFRIRMRDRHRGLVVGVGGVVLRTDDGGGRWTVEPLGVEPAVDEPLFEIVSGADDELVFGASGIALRGASSGWQRLRLRLPLLTWIAAGEFARQGEFAGQRGFVAGGRGVVLRTDDGGRSWRAVGRFAGAS